VRNPSPAIDVKAPVRLSLLEWLIPLSLLNALFAAFVIVQFAVLFGGHDHVLETAGLTYSESTNLTPLVLFQFSSIP